MSVTRQPRNKRHLDSSASSCSNDTPDLKEVSDEYNIVPVEKMTYANECDMLAMDQNNPNYAGFMEVLQQQSMSKQPQAQPQQQPLSPDQKSSEPKSSKRTRTVFSSNQLVMLEKEFKNSNYLCRATRYNLSKSLRLSERQIKIWFQNRRMKLKKDKKFKDVTEKSKSDDYGKMSVVSPISDIKDDDLPKDTYEPHQSMFLQKQEQSILSQQYVPNISLEATRIPTNHYYAPDYGYDNFTKDKNISNNIQKSATNYQQGNQRDLTLQGPENFYMHQLPVQNFQPLQPQLLPQTQHQIEYAKQQQIGPVFISILKGEDQVAIQQPVSSPPQQQHLPSPQHQQHLHSPSHQQHMQSPLPQQHTASPPLQQHMPSSPYQQQIQSPTQQQQIQSPPHQQQIQSSPQQQHLQSMQQQSAIQSQYTMQYSYDAYPTSQCRFGSNVNYMDQMKSQQQQQQASHPKEVHPYDMYSLSECRYTSSLNYMEQTPMIKEQQSKQDLTQEDFERPWLDNPQDIIANFSTLTDLCNNQNYLENRHEMTITSL